MFASKRELLFATTACAVLMAGLGAAPRAHAQESVEAEKPSEVVVTGSRIRRAATDTSAPIDFIGTQDLADRGFTNVGEALNNITSNTPSLPETPNSSGPAGSGQTYPNLFNLGPGRTLSLVDGKRFVSSSTPVTSSTVSGAGSAVDTNLIPIGLLDHVEVVEAGGAAVYGSDAIAGVVNYVMKKNFTGLEVDAQAGISDRNDHAEDSARVTWGTNFAQGKGNIAVDLEWAKTDPLLMSDRINDIGAIGRYSAGTQQIANARFWEFNTTGVIFTTPAPTPVCGGANCFARTAGVPQTFSADGTTLMNYNPGLNINGGTALTPPFASGGDGYGLSQLTALSTGVERYTANVLSHYDFSSHLKLSGSFLYGHTRGDDPAGSQGFSQTILNTPASGSGYIAFTKNNPYLSAAEISQLSAASATFAAGGPLFLSKEFTDILPTNHFIYTDDTYRGQIGLDGDFTAFKRNFYYSLSYSHGQVRSEEDGWGVYTARFNNAIASTKNAAGQIVCSINATTVTDPNCAPIDPFGTGTISAAAKAYVDVPIGYIYNNKEDDVLATLGGDIIKLPAGETKFSVAYEHRDEKATYTPDSANQLGLIGSGSTSPVTGGNYETNEFSGEILVPILGPGFNLPLAKTVEFNAQGRTVDNSIAGHNTVWGLGLRWEVVDGLTFRFSRSQNFRAPTLYQINAPSSTVLAGGIQDPCDYRYVNAGAAPTTRYANCLALFTSNPLYGTGSAGGAAVGSSAATRLATFQDSAVNFSTALVTSGGNAKLKNEVSETITYGAVFQPRWVPGRFVATIDYISVTLANGITAFTPTNFTQSCFDSPSATNATCSFFTRDTVGDVATAQSTTYNAAQLKYQGETATIDYRFPVEWIMRRPGLGNLELQLDTTHNEMLRQNVQGAVTQLVGTTSEPRWVVRGDVRWTYGPLRLTYEAYYLPSAYAAQGASALNSAYPYISDNLRHSVSASYDFGRFQVRGGVNNITDKLVSYPTLFYGDYVGRTFFVGVKARY